MELYYSLTTDPVSRLDAVEVVEIGPDEPVSMALTLMRENKVGSVVICRDGRLVGIFTERDALRIITEKADVGVPISSVMTCDPVTVRRSDTIATVIQRMDRGGYRRIPIVDSRNRPVGMVSVKRVVRYLVEHFPATVYNLPPVARHTTRDREGA